MRSPRYIDIKVHAYPPCARTCASVTRTRVSNGSPLLSALHRAAPHREGIFSGISERMLLARNELSRGYLARELTIGPT